MEVSEMEQGSKVTKKFTKLINVRDHEIAYGFGGPSEKNVSPH